MSTRDRILDAADQAISEYGVAGATTKRIAKQAGCSEALLYKHFASKEELFLAVVLERTPALGPALDELRAGIGGGDLHAALVAFTLAALRFYTRTQAIMGGMLGDPALIAGFRAMLAENHTGPHVPLQVLADILRAEQRAGRIDAALDADAAASMLLGACFHRASLSRFVDLPGPGDKEWAGAIVATLFR